MNLKFIDLFCGAGGVTTGIERARIENKKIAEVIACVNHDPMAIASHHSNHPNSFHFTEDIRTLNLDPLKKLINEKMSNNDILCLWASLECTNFSRAKGGKPRDADSRTLANDLLRYILTIDPDYIMIENVEEFMSWGPLDENGKPKSKYEGVDYINWVNKIKNMGYSFDWRILNSADYGAYTSRKRYFAIFAKNGYNIQFPMPTHSKKPQKGMFGNLHQWKPVKEVLDFTDSGESIFKRKKPLSENTLKRIYAGLQKYISWDNSFILKYNSKKKKSDDKEFNNTVSEINTPLSTITTQRTPQLVQAAFLSKYYGTGNNVFGIEDVCSTLTTKDRIALVQCDRKKHFIQRYYSKDNGQSILSPAGTIMTNDKHALVSAYLLNPQWGKGSNQSINKPCFTLIARMDKAPPYLVNPKYGLCKFKIENQDSETMKLIKIFMKENYIYDIKMRMLKISELLDIQGFGSNYKLLGTKADQKKFIGNSVVPIVAQKLIESIYIGIIKGEKVKVA